MTIIAGVPCRHEKNEPSCWICNNWDREAGYIQVGTPPSVDVTSFVVKQEKPDNPKANKISRSACYHLGKILEPSPSCSCGPLYQCKKYESCRSFVPGPSGSRTCLGCESYVPRDEVVPEPKAGVVIGTYGLPNLVALQVKLIRKHNGNIPIMILDDCSDGTGVTPIADSNFGKICKISREDPNVSVWSNPERLGHAGGDMSAFFVGIQWAAVRKLDVLVKLSFRFVFDRPDWVNIWMKEFWPTGLATSTRAAIEGGSSFPVRSEAMMMDVAKWNQPEILDHIRPRPLSKEEGKFGVATENVLWDTIRDRLDAKFHLTSLFGENRYFPEPNKGYLWHCCTSPAEYRAVFDREGIPMDPDFSTDGWVKRPGYQG